MVTMPHTKSCVASSGGFLQRNTFSGAQRARQRDVHNWVLDVMGVVRGRLGICHSTDCVPAISLVTDCTGLDAPGAALAMAQHAGVLQLKHLSACEKEPAIRQYILRNTSPGCLFQDMLQREFRINGTVCGGVDTITGKERDLPLKPDLYVAGPPCTPFSRRNPRATLFDDPQARVFLNTLQTIRSILPAAAIVENVPGLLRTACKPLLDVEFQKNSDVGYVTAVLRNASPTDLGYPALRERVLIILARRELVKPDLRTDQCFQEVMTNLWCSLAQSLRCTATSLLEELAGSGPIVTGTVQLDLECKGTRCGLNNDCDVHHCHCQACRRSTTRLGCKWRKVHKDYLKQHRCQSSAGYIDHLVTRRLFTSPLLSSPRERHLLEMVWAKHGERALKDAVLDLSQGIHMIGLRLDGVAGTIATSAKTFVMRWGRALSAAEKMLLMGFDVQEMDLANTPARWQHHMAGNTMHVAVIGAVWATVLPNAEHRFLVLVCGGLDIGCRVYTDCYFSWHAACLTKVELLLLAIVGKLG